MASQSLRSRVDSSRRARLPVIVPRRGGYASRPAVCARTRTHGSVGGDPEREQVFDEGALLGGGEAGAGVDPELVSDAAGMEGPAGRVGVVGGDDPGAELAVQERAEASANEIPLAREMEVLYQAHAETLLRYTVSATASLDFANQARVLAQLASLVDEGLGVVFSTHQPAQAHRLARSVLALDGRGLTRYGPADEILTPALLSRVYGVAVTRTDLAGGEALFSVA